MPMSSVLPGPLSAQQPDQTIGPPETQTSHDHAKAELTRSRGQLALARMTSNHCDTVSSVANLPPAQTGENCGLGYCGCASPAPLPMSRPQSGTSGLR